MSDDVVALIELEREARITIEELEARIEELEARIGELEASVEFWSTSWSNEHTALVLAQKRIEELERDVLR